MSNKTENLRLVVLWEDEIRTASALLRDLQRLWPDNQDEDASEEAVSCLFRSVNACIAALWDADDKGAALVLSSQPILGRSKKKMSNAV